MVKELVSIITDTRCLLCQKPLMDLKTVCPDCFEGLLRLDAASCSKCGNPLMRGICLSCRKENEIYFDQYDFINHYQEIYQSLVYQWKLNQEWRVNELFLDLLISKELIRKDIPVVIIPDNFLKSFRKGRSGLYYLGRRLRQKGYQVITGLLERKLAINEDQKSKSALARMKGLEKSFRINWRYPREKIPEKVVLIDDIYTTGSTLNYCAKLLKSSGCRTVYAVSFFRAVLRE